VVAVRIEPRICSCIMVLYWPSNQKGPGSIPAVNPNTNRELRNLTYCIIWSSDVKDLFFIVVSLLHFIIILFFPFVKSLSHKCGVFMC
jgi:hypothetical protein